MKIELVRAPNPGPFTLDGTNSWVLSGRVVIDPGPSIASHVEALLERAGRLEKILVTHRHADHAAAAIELARRSGASLFAPEGVLSAHVARGLVDGEVVASVEGVDIRVIATPGHTGEHVCFLGSEGDLFTGDTILGEGTTAIFPPDGHMGDYLASLAKLRALEPKRIHPGHGPTREDALELIDAYIAHRHERERQILAALEGRQRSLGELRGRIYPDLPPALHRGAEAQLTAHLIHLQEHGRVRILSGDFAVKVLS
ncbi:MAG TPA: MBL fold metallo-hydrolase [Thermoanaerobaculia bacterium]|nr:MBL fold metallo-hydrolase [Thermoanaerobaculia bacterium]